MPPRPFRFSLLGLALALVLAPVAASASEPTDLTPLPTPWMGTAVGDSSLHIGHKASLKGDHKASCKGGDHKASSKGKSTVSRILGSWASLNWAAKNRDRDAIELDVRVDEQRVQMTETGTSRQWGGTYAKHGKHGTKLRVVYDEASMSALTEYLLDRVASMHRARDMSSSDLDLSIVDYDVKIKVDPERRRFAVKGKVRYAATHAGQEKPEHGSYHFSAKGDAHEDTVVVSEEPAQTRVLLLGDNGSEPQVEAALAAAGHAVTTIALYSDWDGVTPDVSEFDVVVYLDGYDYGKGLTPEADAAVAAFVANGGGLVRTEWSVWAGMVNAETDRLMPLTYAGTYKSAPEWNVILPGHALVANVPTVWYDTNGYSYADPDASATVVMQSEGGYPLLTYRNDTGGTVVHINHDLTFKGTAIDSNALQLFVNAVEFAAPTAGP